MQEKELGMAGGGKFSYELAGMWPPLAWIAKCQARSGSIHIIHGGGIERRAEWFCEAVWDGQFAEGNFDQTDLVFGSGGRSRSDGVIFVSAGSTVDRLQFAVRGHSTFISNSLACLLEAIDARLEPSFRGYDELFEKIVLGIDQSFPDIPIAGGRIQFIYYNNLRWDGGQLLEVPKPAIRRTFDSFENYTNLVQAALRRMGENMSSPQRTKPFSWMGTISRGYDSGTCAALARNAGLRRVITHDESRPGQRDDGVAVAKALELECIMVNRLAWKRHRSLEPLFLSADAQGKEIMIAAAPVRLDHTVFVTGHGGDTAWSMNSPAGENLARGAHSGLSMTEYRLHAGFIHFPLPFIGLRQLPDLKKLSHADEMKTWDIGGNYNRPICRRILEQAGVPRGAFGITKTGASIRFLRGEDAWSPGGKRAFFTWLRTHRRNCGIGLVALLELRFLILGLEIALLLGRRMSGRLGRGFRRVARRLAARIKRRGLNDMAFLWAIECVRKIYRLEKT